MKLNFRMKIIVFLLSICFSLLGIEIGLRLVDPWGMNYFWDVADIWNQAEAHPNRIAALPPGRYRLRGWTVNQLDNFTRRVPASQGGECEIVFVGDSMTWGHGVDDDETWVNLVAAQLRGTTVINAGFDQYNSDNVLRALADFPDADLFVYLVIDNDAEPTVVVTHQPTASMLKMYLVYGAYYLTTGDTGTIEEENRQEEKGRFESDIAQLAADGRVVFFGFDEPLARSLIPDYPITLLPSMTHPLSLVDRHPDPEGHKDFAASILPDLQTAVAEHCP
ncbi:MAG: SGNH/GDSL hydrolase family protein [Chloroflexi bacterium]|nr:SGNH/GDSL hydrolase family protein [Chloroflexota bacterium]